MPWSSVGGLWQLGRGSPAPLGRRATALHRSPPPSETPARSPTHHLLPTPSRRVLLGPPQQGAAGLVRRGATGAAAPPCALACRAAPRRPAQAARTAAAARLLAALRGSAPPAALVRCAPHPAAPPSPQFLLGIRQRRPPDAGPGWQQKWVSFVKARVGGTPPCCKRLSGQGRGRAGAGRGGAAPSSRWSSGSRSPKEPPTDPPARAPARLLTPPAPGGLRPDRQPAGVAARPAQGQRHPAPAALLRVSEPGCAEGRTHAGCSSVGRGWSGRPLWSARGWGSSQRARSPPRADQPQQPRPSRHRQPSTRPMRRLHARRFTSHHKARPTFWVADPLKSVVLEVQADLRPTQSSVGGPSLGWLGLGAPATLRAAPGGPAPPTLACSQPTPPLGPRRLAALCVPLLAEVPQSGARAVSPSG